MHNTKSELAGKTVVIKKDIEHPQDFNFGGSDYIVEDWYDRVNGKSWLNSDGNPACLIYAMRTVLSPVPTPINDEVLYGHTSNGLGHLVHVSEIESDN